MLLNLLQSKINQIMNQIKSRCSVEGKKRMYEIMINDDDNRRSRRHSKYRYDFALQSSTSQHQQQPHQLQQNNNTYQLQSLINKQLTMAITCNNQNFISHNNHTAHNHQNSPTHKRGFKNKKTNNLSLFHTHSNKNNIDKWEHSQSPFLIWRKTHYLFKEKQSSKQTVMYSPHVQQQSNINKNNDNYKNLDIIRQSLTMLKTKQQHLSPKRSYDEFINRLNKFTTANPQTKQQLINELQVSKLGRNLLLERQKKSFSLSHKVKSKVLKDKAGYKLEDIGVEGNEIKNIQQKQQYYFVSQRIFFDNVTPCKISPLKPIQIHPNEKKKSHLHSPSNHLQEICPYKAKKQYQIPQKRLKQRKNSARQTLSPYHNELSAWS